ncbi:hypothetical protein [Herbaspirillum robiniae]|uniref:hypothetical protein n=1 Tax=Herbaspirillum robiniae TaxID=2014887 RepID=UPI001EDB6640|nr:hypothetical protein [Herbaspirillum robiniae]
MERILARARALRDQAIPDGGPVRLRGAADAGIGGRLARGRSKWHNGRANSKKPPDVPVDLGLSKITQIFSFLINTRTRTTRSSPRRRYWNHIFDSGTGSTP